MNPNPATLRQSGLSVIAIEGAAVNALRAGSTPSSPRAATCWRARGGSWSPAWASRDISAARSPPPSPAPQPGVLRPSGRGQPWRSRHDHPSDVVLALSNSGETSEIVTIVPLIQAHGRPL